MVTRKKATPSFPSPTSGLLGGTDISGISPAYYQELQETFQLFDTENKGVLSIKKLRLAMRTLGFEASADDIEEIIQEMPELSVHLTKKKKQQKSKPVQKAKTKGKDPKSSEMDKVSIARRSSRAAAVASRTASKSKYVDSDVDEPSEEDEDIYEDNNYDIDDEERDKTEDSELYFTMQDFITIMTPNEEQHGQDEISRVFQLFDTQGKGSIRLEDLRRVATELGIHMKEEELREMIEEADRDGDGAVSEQEFGKIMKKTGF